MAQDNKSESFADLGKEQALPFRAKARIISEIGDELISSDAIALYELIKNTYDADSPFALIEITTPMPATTLNDIIKLARDTWENGDIHTRASLLDQAKALIQTNYVQEQLQTTLQALNTSSLETALRREFQRLSTIRIIDEGHGMSRDILEDAFLAVGTPMRRQQREQGRMQRAKLGEKGVGRFSTKRLGNLLTVETMTIDEPIIHQLHINWHQYNSDSDLFLDEVYNPLISLLSTKDRKPGTTLTITDLNDIWDIEKLRTIARDHLAKLINPFFSFDFRILLRFNNEPVDLLKLQQDVLRLSRIHIKGRVDPEAETPLVFNEFVYKQKNKDPLIKPMDYQLPSVSDLQKVGAFDFEIYEFDRNDRTLQRIGRKSIVGHFLDTWGGGGLMLFRDGFRVMPYGSQGNDWLEIDKAFFRERGGTRLRTHAMTGYVAITSEHNHRLTDQTNREGLRENDAYRIFRKTLQRIISILNTELKNVDPPITTTRPDTEVRRLERTGKQLSTQIKTAEALSLNLYDITHNNVEAANIARQLVQIFKQISEATRTYDDISNRLQKYLSIEANRYQTLVELAGLGMTAEQVSHELNSLLDRCRGLIDQLNKSIKAPTERLLLGQLTANLRSLRELASFLEPLTNAARKQRIELDILKELQIVSQHYPSITSGKVHFRILITPTDAQLRIRTNRGLVLQVFDNLLSNALYWLEQTQVPEPTITIYIDVEQGTIIVEDNGLGIDPDLSELIFQPFVSTKSSGRGLGLFIVRELLELEGGEIHLLPERNLHDRLYRFQVRLNKSST